MMVVACVVTKVSGLRSLQNTTPQRFTPATTAHTHVLRVHLLATLML